MNYICFYHSPCNDGELAKNIWKHKYPNTVFFPWIHSNEQDNAKFLNTFKNENIVFLDYCPKRQYLNNNNKYLIIDHHKNAISYLTETDNIKLYCDTNRSGGMLTWDYIYPEKPYPLCVLHIGHFDLFNFDNKSTEPFSLAYKNYNLDFNTLINLDVDSEIYKKIIKEGTRKIIHNRFEAITYFYKFHVEYEKIDNKEIKIIVIYCDKYNLYKYLIEIGKSQFKDFNILKIIKNKGHNVSYSLRSLDGTPVDSIARKYGGNGHPMAAGYTINYN